MPGSREYEIKVIRTGISRNKGKRQTMTDRLMQILRNCGFNPSAAEFVKQDSRGKEYGYYGVTVTPAAASTDPVTYVSKRTRDGMLDWQCRFDDNLSFRRWAQDNT